MKSGTMAVYIEAPTEREEIGCRPWLESRWASSFAASMAIGIASAGMPRRWPKK